MRDRCLLLYQAGFTALTFSAFSGHEAIVMLLLDNGASFDIQEIVRLAQLMSNVYTQRKHENIFKTVTVMLIVERTQCTYASCNGGSRVVGALACRKDSDSRGSYQSMYL